ncbi:MAG TPA: DUF1697 domain-containing protein [Bacteroidota bacterium]|nr:DUF1697 domain-containing protein [Bacteroidota bacterium]
MKTYIALFRAINVGGKNALPMKELAVLLQKLGCVDVRTYIQSGNVVLTSAEKSPERLSVQISKNVKANFGFDPTLKLLEARELETAISNNPFPEAAKTPEYLHAGFLLQKPVKPDLQKLESLKQNGERFQLKDKIFYLHAPKGVGKSKLAASSEKLLGVPMTDRNWRTVCKIRDMAREINERRASSR